VLLSLDDIGPPMADSAVQQAFERSSGLPWDRTVSTLAGIYGVSSWRSFEDAVFLPGIQGLGFDQAEVRFRHRVFPPRFEAPAYEFQAEVNPFQNDRENHRFTLQHLTKQFGRPPRVEDVSNCLQASWEFGLFQVSVATFLRERRLSGGNSLYARNPDLWLCSNVSAESRLFAVRVPERVDWSDGFDLQVSSGVRLGLGDFRTNRVLANPRNGERPRVWRDRTRGVVGIANRWASIVCPLRAESRVTLQERTPARGGGSCSLELDGVVLLFSWEWLALRQAAKKVADWYGVPLSIESYPDE
jgi:hypothetical protein